MRELDPRKSLQALYARSLVRERTRAKMTQDQLGAHPAVIVSGKLIGHVENCRRPPTERLSKGIDKALDLEHVFEALYTHYIEDEGPPSAIWEYIDLEDRASSIKVYNSMWITGLLQNEEYARAQIRTEHREDAVEQLVAARLDRQQILRRDEPPWLLVALDEFVIRRIVSDREVTRRQLEHLLNMAQEPNISIVIVPNGAPVYPNGSFIHLGFPDTPDVSFTESAGGHSQLVNNTLKVKEMLVKYDRITSVAMTVADSEKLIRTVLEDL